MLSDVHQIIIGALNAGENSFSVGDVEGLNFVACAVGADVVILAPNLERIHIIIGRIDAVVSSVNCCRESGKIAACYGSFVQIFEPIQNSTAKNIDIFAYQWTEVQTIHWPSVIFSVQWALKGLRLLIVSDEDLLLYQHKILSTVVVNRPATITAAGANTTGVKFMLTDEEVLWENVWNTKLSDSVKHIRFSPDGSLFATCGENDRFIKIWYQMKDSSVFSFIYIQHPAPVCGFEWRIGGRYMKCVQNAIITWCEDNTSRVWKEVPSRDTTHDSILEAAETAMHEKQRRERVQLGGFTGGGGEGTHRHFHLKHAKRRLIKKLSHIVNDKKTARALPTFINNTINNNNNYLGRTLTIADFSMPASANSLLFALAATINAENDCYLMPTMGARSTRPFTVHWLNNKAMFFTRAIERVLAETLLTEQNQQFCHPDDRANAFVSSTSSTDVTTMAASAEHIERVIAPEEFRHGPLTVASTPALSQQDSEKYSSCASDVSSARDMIDVKLEQFLRQWNKSADVLFAIHPVDGSLLTWTMEWLDDTWRQANVNFASRFPDAFPLTDAVSIYPTLSVFDAYEPTLTKYLRQAISDSGYERYNDTNIISLLTNHENGSLNLWQLSMDEQRGHATPLNLTHRNRICGHRFYISQVVAHPALPLLLTTSQFSPSTVIGTRQSRQQSPRSYDDDAIGKLERDKDIHDEFADVTRESELILWSTSPVAPLCKSGGLRELARVTSRLAQPFSFMAWIPITIPSFVMGAECNSSSSCFIVSSDGILSIYQAIVDARGILAHVHKSHRRMQDFIHKENSDSENCTQISINDYKATKTSSIAMFNVISTQSSARPGCILHVGNVINSKHKSDEIIFLHVFVEDLAAYSFSKPTNVESKLDGASKDNGKTNQFKGFEKTTPISQNNRLIFVEKYLLVMIVRTGEEDRLRMWTLTISAKSLSLAPEIANDNVSSPTSATVLLTQKSREIFYPTAETDVIQLTATKLYTESEMVYDEALNFGLNVRISSCTAAAGHLSSASLYPSCKTPYTLLAACTDDKVRFLRCNVVEADVDRNSSSKRVYRWTCWKMANELTDSLLEMDGEIFSVSSAYSGRFACVSRCAGATCVANAFAFNNDGTSVAFVDAVPAIARRLELAVFECESSGGVEWIREETFVLGDILDNYFRKYSAAILSSDNVSYITNTNNAVDIQRTCSTLVRIDWVSAEDGSHVLTVGIGNYILLFVQVSQNIAQQNIVMMKEHESVCAKRAPPPLRKSSSLVNTAVNSECLVRWMCIRILELQSADGLPPIPTALSWVRDGLLIVGMNSEMRVYNQWNLNTRSDSKNNEENSIQNHTASLANPLAIVKGTTMESVISISRSHSMLNQLNRKGVDQRAASSRALTDLMNRVLSSSRFLPNTASSISAIVTGERDELSNGGILRAVSGEGLFEASRLANPILPQYHPKQLIEMLNAGKIKRVKAILLHVLYALRHRQVSLPNPLSRAASFRRMYSRDACATGADSMSVNGAGTLREESTANPDYDELDTISPLPLYALMAADQTASGFDTVENIDCADKRKYDSLFNAVESDDDLDEMLNGIQNESETLSQRSASRSRQSSESSERPAHTTATSGRVDFTTRHSRLLTELLTHTHLPGLSSVDQMHLLAIADTISHFSSNAMDKLQHANAALKPVMASTLDDTSASGYANATTGTETVDECGLRFLMAMKQHEYLLLCLPPMQRKLLKSRGISTAHIIWAFHSVTEAELLGAIPCCQKSQEMWDDLKAFGVAWWLKNTSMLRICVEKMAKCAFQQNQDPMDASLFYLALRKKNVLMHLFKTVNNSRMYEFFREDFTEEKWKRAALKNAFVLMSKQRFQHAAAFFLLGGSLKDAVQTILSRLRDIQLAMVVVRLYETDLEIQNHIMAELLCHEVLGCEPEDIYARDNSCDAYIRDQETHCANFPYTSRDPFERSMALWMIKEYAQAASTLVDEASRDRMLNGHNDSAATAASVFTGVQQHSLFDIFNFYVFLRKHPLVVRQRLTNAGILVTSTEQFLALAKQLESRMTASERRLYFRTASAHIALGCPLLALDVLSRMPKHFSLADGNLLNITRSASFATTESTPMENVQKAEDIDWSAPINTIGEDQLELDWGEENKIDDKKNEDEADNWKKNRLDETKDNTFTFSKNSDEDQQMDYETNDSEINPERIVDFISQHLKYVAVLRILMDELSTLASGFEINGGQLRYELFNWLEKECDILHEICDFRTGDFQSEPAPEIDAFMVSLNEIDSDRDGDGFSSIPQSTAHGDGRADLPLHESLRLDRLNFKLRLRAVVRRRNWLRGHEKLLRIFVAYCSLHSAQNYRLTSIQMELLLLLLEVQSDGGVTRFFAKEPLPYIHSFPLLISALSSCRMFVTSPLQFMRNQSDDILGTFCEFVEPPSVENSFAEVLMIYNLCQGLSSCVYQSLSDIFQFPLAYSSTSGLNGACALTANVIAHYFATADEVQVRTPAAKWPGVESFIALLGRERDEDTPDLRLLLVEFFTAIIVSLFAYALTVYDARWLFRLCAHRLDERAFSTIFGGGGERRLRSTISTRPSPPIANIDKARFAVDSTLIDASQADSAAIRAKLHAKVFGADLTRGKISQTSTSAMLASMTTASSASEQSVTCWVPPTKHIVQFFAEKVNAVDAGNLSPACAYDSESEDTLEDGFVGDDNEEDADFDTEEANVRAVTYSYAWLLLRLASSIHIQQRIHEFVTLSGFDIQDIAMTSAHMDNILRTLRDWTRCLEKQLDAFEGGCPENFLRNMQITTTPATIHQTPLLRKYSTLLESGNTPFEAQTRASSSARRLWCFLIRQEHLSPYFVKHIFGRTDMTDDKETSTSNGTISTPLNSAAGNGTFLPSYHNSISEPMKIVQREHEPIVAFACNSLRPSCIVVSSGREVQEINLNRIFDENDENSDFGVQKLSMVGGAFDLNDYGGGFLNSRVELDIAMQSLQRDTLRDNDDYQLITPHDHYGHGHYAYHGHHGSGVANGIGGGKLVGGVTCMRKRPISGIRRLEAHSILPYYVSGSTDGSILLWEWGVEQPLFTARVAGQYAKVAKLAFAQNANKFAAVDGDGLLCIWQAAQHCTSSRPFFSQRCHSKTATDVKFLGQTSSLLVTAGHGAGEQNVALWDTLMPSAKAMVHAFSNQHQEGATCVLYVPNSQSILSGGRHGEICVWDLRQCQLRAAFRAFDSGSVRCMCLDASGDAFVAGSSEGDIKVWSTMDSMLSQSQPQPSLLYSLSCEHVARSGFTLRKLGGSSGVAGVQQVFVDARQRLFSCGADSSLKFRTLPPAHFAV